MVPNKKNHKQSGVALIIVLLIVALVSILATEMGSRLQLQVKRAVNIKDNNQAYWYAMGAEQFAGKAIRDLVEENDGVINLEQPWSEELTYPLEGGGIQAQLQDSQSCFNLNALGEPEGDNTDGAQASEALDAFHQLLTLADIGIDSFSADTLRDSVADWLDEDSNLRSYGAEDADYESRAHPYLAANGLMTNKSEIRLINGVEQSWLQDLLPYICVLPDVEALKINVNTLTEEKAPVLAALTGLSVADATSLIGNRGDKGYDKKEDFFAEPEIAALNLNETRKAWFDVTTEHFILHTKTRYNNATFNMATLFKVSQQQVSVIRREFGGVQ